jgi:predicted RNase H-like HicB family nuclease
VETNTLKIAHIHYQFEDGKWIASCDEVGLVGYQSQSLERVKTLVNEGLELFFEDRPFQIVESFSDLDSKI